MSFDMAVRIVEDWFELSSSPRAEERPPLEVVTKQSS
jgi:hypothetical protein